MPSPLLLAWGNCSHNAACMAIMRLAFSCGSHLSRYPPVLGHAWALHCKMSRQLSTWEGSVERREHAGPRRLPQAQIIPGISGRMVTRPDGSVLNTCSIDVLVEMLRFLKRSFWCAIFLYWAGSRSTGREMHAHPGCDRSCHEVVCLCVGPSHGRAAAAQAMAAIGMELTVAVAAAGALPAQPRCDLHVGHGAYLSAGFVKSLSRALVCGGLIRFGWRARSARSSRPSRAQPSTAWSAASGPALGQVCLSFYRQQLRQPCCMHSGPGTAVQLPEMWKKGKSAIYGIMQAGAGGANIMQEAEDRGQEAVLGTCR